MLPIAAASLAKPGCLALDAHGQPIALGFRALRWLCLVAPAAPVLP